MSTPNHPAPPKPFEVFTKPRHPRYNWDGYSEAKHAAAVLACIAHDSHVREGRKVTGFPSLKRLKGGPARPDNKVRFGSLPKRERPLAETELARRINEIIARTGHPPSHAKIASLMGNVAWIFKYVRTGKRSAWCKRNLIYRRMLDGLDAKEARRNTPAAKTTERPRAKHAWRGLAGI